MTEQSMSPESGAPSGRGLNWSEGFRRLWAPALAAGLGLLACVQDAFGAEAKVLEFTVGSNSSQSATAFGSDVNLITTGYSQATYSSVSQSVVIPVTPGAASIGFGSYVPESYTGPGAIYLYLVEVKDNNGNIVLSETFDNWTGSLTSNSDGTTTGSYTGVANWNIYHDSSSIYQGYGLPFSSKTDGADNGIVYPVDGSGPFSVLASTDITIPASATELRVKLVWGYDVNIFNGSSSRTFSIGFKNQITPTKRLFSFAGPANAAPVASAVAVTTTEDTSKEVTLSAADTDGNALTYSIVAGPSVVYHISL